MVPIINVAPTIKTVFPIFFQKPYIFDQKRIAFQGRMIRQIVNGRFKQFPDGVIDEIKIQYMGNNMIKATMANKTHLPAVIRPLYILYFPLSCIFSPPSINLIFC